MEQVAYVQGGIQKQPARIPKQNAYPYLRVANVLRGHLDLTQIEKMELFGNELEKLRLEKGDLLIVEGNGSPTEIGRCAIWKEEIVNCIHQNHIIRARLNYIRPEYVECCWNSLSGRERVRTVAASTSGLYTLSVSKVSQIPFPLPPLAEQEQIVALVEERLSIIGELEATIEKALKRAERQRQSILHQAFTGKLVPQNPEDEPANVLLELIRQELEQEKQKKQAIKIKPQASKNKKPSSTAQTSWPPDKPFEPINSAGIAQESLWQEADMADVSTLANGTGNNSASGEREQDGSRSAIIQSGTQK